MFFVSGDLIKQHLSQHNYTMEHLAQRNYTVEDIYNYYYISFPQYWACSTEFYIHNVLRTYLPPIMIITASIGNIISFFVLSTKKLKSWSVCVYLSAFAFCNIMVLIVGSGSDWFAHITETPYVANIADWSCRLWQFVFNMILATTSWMVVAMITDRFVAICVPSKASVICTKFVAKVICILIVVFLMVFSIHAMWTYELTVNGCYIDPNQGDFQSISWPYISATLYSYVPITSITFMLVSVFIGKLCCKPFLSLHTNEPDKHQLAFTNATMLVSFCHVTLNLPMIIINLLEYSNPMWSAHHDKLAQLYLARTIGQTLAYFSHSITYLIYFTTVPLFRTELYSLIKQVCATTCNADVRQTTVTLTTVQVSDMSRDCDDATLL